MIFACSGEPSWRPGTALGTPGAPHWAALWRNWSTLGVFCGDSEETSDFIDIFFDFSMKYNPNAGNWYVGLYAKNLADDQYIGGWAASSPLQGGSYFGTYTDPRTYGVTFGRDF